MIASGDDEGQRRWRASSGQSSFGIHSAKRAIASAANSTIAPCAKLNTPEALKISTKPSATSE